MKKVILSLILFASITCTAQSYVPESNNPKLKVKPIIPVKAFAFNLSEVKLLNSPFKHAMEMDSAYLLSLKPDRLLHRFHLFAGLPTKDSIYRGWESDGLSGHTLGHHFMHRVPGAPSSIEIKP